MTCTRPRAFELSRMTDSEIAYFMNALLDRYRACDDPPAGPRVPLLHDLRELVAEARRRNLDAEGAFDWTDERQVWEDAVTDANPLSHATEGELRELILSYFSLSARIYAMSGSGDRLIGVGLWATNRVRDVRVELERRRQTFIWLSSQMGDTCAG